MDSTAMTQQDDTASHAFDTREYWDMITGDHMRIAQATFADTFDSFNQWVEAAVNVIESGRKLIFFGNGGSAADAQHIVAEMSVKLKQDRAPIAALSLSLDASAITACGNDYGFDQIFKRQIACLGHRGDMVVGLSTSGNSENVLNALQHARDMHMITAGLGGESGGKMAALCDIMLKIPATDSGRIQEMHITLGHLFVGALEQRLGLV